MVFQSLKGLLPTDSSRTSKQLEKVAHLDTVDVDLVSHQQNPALVARLVASDSGMDWAVRIAQFISLPSNTKIFYPIAQPSI